MGTTENIFKQLLDKWRGWLFIKALILGTCFTIPLSLVGWYFFNAKFLWFCLLGILIGGVYSVIYFLIKKPSLKNVLEFLDKLFPQLEFSSFLLLKDPAKLNIVEQIQFERTIKKLEALTSQISVPVKIKPQLYLLAILLVTTLVIGKSVSILQIPNKVNLTTKNLPADTLAIQVANDLSIVPVVSSAGLQITPPAYTGLGSNYLTDLNATVPQQSSLSWSFKFTGIVNHVALQFTNGQQLKGNKVGESIFFKWKAASNSIYQLVYSDDTGKSYKSNYYKIEVIEDRKPEITINDLPQYQAFDYGELATFDVNAILTDDYGLTDAYLVATISKGSGESVKFREERISLAAQLRKGVKSQALQKTIDLYKMQADPGDELYFYLEAVDNRFPNPQKQRTETYFALLKDSTREVITVEGGLGVDFMPEYFRSQRQLIIDTEKLIAQRGKIPTKEFNNTSNNIGYDQKVLRLRYGEFLGEEFESNIGGAGNIEADHDHGSSEGSHDEKVKALVEEHAHLHDTQSEMERGLLETHDHDHGNTKPNESETITLNNGAEVSAEMVHTHDSEEAATFYFDATKAKLKAALSLMWESELHLRMNEPEKALPVEYEILKLLKEVQQKSRIYVERIGFEPPPIKESKRLQGELEEIETPTYQNNNQDSTYLSGVRAAIAVLENVRVKERKLMAWEKLILQKAGNEVASLALEAPNEYLELLKKIEKIQGSGYGSPEFIYHLQKQLLTLLPEAFHKKFTPVKNKSRLEQLFMQEINSLP